MNTTIHYISDFTYIREPKHLKAHINYILRSKAKPQSTLLVADKINVWMERAQFEKNKRHDSVIALKFVVALPNDRLNDTKFYSEVGHFLRTFFNIEMENVDLTIHRDNVENLHAHVLIYPRDIHGKKLRLNKKDLARFHKEWDAFLKRNGYEIVKDELEDRISHIGYMLHKDPTVKTAYINYKQNKKQKKQLNSQIEVLEKKKQDLDQKIFHIEWKINNLKAKIDKLSELQRKQKDEQKRKQLREKMFLTDMLFKNLEQADERYVTLRMKINEQLQAKQQQQQHNKVTTQNQNNTITHKPDTKAINNVTKQNKMTDKPILDISGINKSFSRLEDSLNNLQQILEAKKQAKANITKANITAQSKLYSSNTITSKPNNRIDNKPITDKPITETFGDEVYTVKSTVKQDNNNKLTYKDQTEDDIAGILFGDDIRQEQRQDKHDNEDKDKGNDKHSSIDLYGLDL